MKIKTKINIVVMLSFCAVFIVSGVIYLSSKRADKESAEAKRADALARAIAEFNIFVFEHSIRHEERPLMQARLKYDSIAGLLKKEEFEFPEEQEILDKINLNYIITGSNLLQIIDLHKKQKPGKEEIVQIQEIEKSLENSILLRSQEMVSDAFRLAAMIRTGEERVHGMIHKLIILFVAILTVGFIAISILLSRSVTNPIIKLHKGTEIIGSGKLNYKVSTHTKDEIGQLSRAFDSMTDNLVKVMASRDELNREVDERKKVEVELFKSKEALELLNNDLEQRLKEIKTLQGILPICSYCKKIRNDKGYWEQMEAYITDHSGALFSHGMCPACTEKAFKELDELKKKKSESGSQEQE